MHLPAALQASLCALDVQEQLLGPALSCQLEMVADAQVAAQLKLLKTHLQSFAAAQVCASESLQGMNACLLHRVMSNLHNTDGLFTGGTLLSLGQYNRLS